VSSTIAKDVFEKMWSSGRQASAIVEAEGLAQINDTSALAAAVADVIAAQPDTVAQYRAGQTKVLGFMVGQVMKATGGKASPKIVNDLLRQALDQAHA
jgi:aspartyl-tRNA(Asn)/glutamyl-tRNA(Gln) amidotransferase subunit B